MTSTIKYQKRDTNDTINHRSSRRSTVQVATLINPTITALDLLSSSTSDGKKDAARRKPVEFQFVYAADENFTVIKEPVGVVGCITP